MTIFWSSTLLLDPDFDDLDSYELSTSLHPDAYHDMAIPYPMITYPPKPTREQMDEYMADCAARSARTRERERVRTANRARLHTERERLRKWWNVQNRLATSLRHFLRQAKSRQEQLHQMLREHEDGYTMWKQGRTLYWGPRPPGSGWMRDTL